VRLGEAEYERNLEPLSLDGKLRALTLLSSANSISHARFYSWSHKAVIRVFDDAGNVIETHEHNGEFKESEFLLVYD
jgi:hypothetical protein